MGFGIYIGIILGIFFGDLWVKNKIEKGDGSPRLLWDRRILIRRYHNRGAMLNMGQHRPRAVAAVSVTLSLALTAVFLLSLGRRGNSLLRAGLALLLGGAFSNTYDRLKRQYVVDYLSFRVRNKRVRNIVFNLSDFCIIIGAMLAAISTA